MVLKPVYHPSSEESGMQYPSQEPDPPSGGTWQTPYGQAASSQDDDRVQPQQSPQERVQDAFHGEHPYAPTRGENSSYYGSAPYTNGSSSSWQDLYGNAQGNTGIAMSQYGQTYAEASGQYGYRHSDYDANQYPAYQQAYQEPEYVKQEMPVDAYAGQNVPLVDLTRPEIRPPVNASPLHASAQENDRGFMGALAGAAAGGYAGHKVHHGFLGTVGGAYSYQAGHKLEDIYKDHRRQPAQQTPMHYESPTLLVSTPARHGNFSASSKDMSLDKDYDLIASCKDIKGQNKLSAISLNAVLTNSDGHFQWVHPDSGAGNFGASARNVKLIDQGRMLEAELRCCNGTWRRDTIRLDERIENSDGDLRMT